MKSLVHLSARALEWLTKHETVYAKGPGGKRLYQAPVGIVACTGERLEGSQRELFCGVEDVRAMYLRLDYKALSSFPGGSLQYKKVPINAPTCIECQVLFDKGCESSPRKTGKWIEVDDWGDWRWVGDGKRRKTSEYLPDWGDAGPQ